jgi:hypothetical protein
MTWYATDGTGIDAESEEQARDIACKACKVLRVDLEEVKRMARNLTVLDFAHKSARDN